VEKKQVRMLTIFFSAQSLKNQQITRNPIYYFYEKVERGANGTLGNMGDKHFRCHHGNKKILTITKAMHCSLNGLLMFLYKKYVSPSSAGLIGNLKSCSPPMFRLYNILKERQDRKDGTISQEEIDIASGKTDLNSSMAADFVKQLDQKTENICKAFAQQEIKSLVRSLFY
jgi:hypothetical protein